MTSEIWVVIGILASLLIIGGEYLLHYRMASRQNDRKINHDNAKRRIGIMIEGILYAPTQNSREEELAVLVKEIGHSTETYETVIAAIDSLRSNADTDGEQLDELVAQIDERVDPIALYAEMLEKGDVYHQGYACRRLADLHADDFRESIIRLTEHKDRDLSYNAAMAMAAFGDAETVATYLLSIQNDTSHSSRIVNEFFSVFTGNRTALARKLFARCNDYMKCTVIKAIAPYTIDEFRPMYIDGASGNDDQRKLACVKALAEFGRPEDEHILQIAAQDKDWVVRSAAIKGLSLLHSETALETVKAALSDKEWWVRQSAAKALTGMNISAKDIEEILSGYDRFAADAVKNVLYKGINMVKEESEEEA